MQAYAPIVFFVYNRPDHTLRTIESLMKNELIEESDLYVFCDGPKADASQDDILKIKIVRNYVHQIKGFKSIHIVEKTKNEGLDPSEIRGITEVINRYGKVIVLEDDLILHKFFLRFMNEALDFYYNEKNVYQISGFSKNLDCLRGKSKHCVYVTYRPESWGWGTWIDRWNKNNWDEKEYDIIKHPTRRKIKLFNRGGDDLYQMLIDKHQGKTDAWDIRWGNTMYENNAYCVSPCRTLVQNIGFDGSGIHCGSLSIEQVYALSAPMYDSVEYNFEFLKNITIEEDVQKSVKKFFQIPQQQNIFSVLIRKLKRLGASFLNGL